MIRHTLTVTSARGRCSTYFICWYILPRSKSSPLSLTWIEMAWSSQLLQCSVRVFNLSCFSLCEFIVSLQQSMYFYIARIQPHSICKRHNNVERLCSLIDIPHICMLTGEEGEWAGLRIAWHKGKLSNSGEFYTKTSKELSRAEECAKAFQIWLPNFIWRTQNLR